MSNDDKPKLSIAEMLEVRLLMKEPKIERLFDSMDIHLSVCETCRNDPNEFCERGKRLVDGIIRELTLIN